MKKFYVWVITRAYWRLKNQDKLDPVVFEPLGQIWQDWYDVREVYLG